MWVFVCSLFCWVVFLVMFEFRLVLGVCLAEVMVVTYLGTTVTNRSSCIGVVAWTSRASLQRHCRELPWDGRSLR